MPPSDVRWPQGYPGFYKQVRAGRAMIQQGLLIAVDPSSGGTSQPGFAVFQAGILINSGEIVLPSSKPVYQRLQLLYKRLSELTEEVPDVFVIEEIRGQWFSHHYLHWSIGASIAAARTPVVYEVPLNVWHALAKADPNYEKTNTADAELIGKSLIALAREADANSGPFSSRPDAPPAAS